MDAISQREDVYKVISGIKQGSKGYLTNFYPNDEKMNYWIEKETFFLQVLSNTAFFFRKDRNFYHLYFCTKDKNCLSTNLNELHLNSIDIIVVDIVGPETDINLVINIFENIGFKNYVLYYRLTKYINQNEALPLVSKDVIFPKLAEAKIITEMFEITFDKYAEQLPTVDEIEAAISDNKITIVKEGAFIIGILMRDMAKYSSLWRFFLVEEKHRGKGVGSKLLNYYFHECKGKKIISWVLDINTNSLELHKHYNFDFDHIRDQIMVNKKNMFYQKNY